MSIVLMILAMAVIVLGLCLPIFVNAGVSDSYGIYNVGSSLWTGGLPILWASDLPLFWIGKYQISSFPQGFLVCILMIFCICKLYKKIPIWKTVLYTLLILFSISIGDWLFFDTYVKEIIGNWIYLIPIVSVACIALSAFFSLPSKKIRKL